MIFLWNAFADCKMGKRNGFTWQRKSKGKNWARSFSLANKKMGPKLLLLIPWNQIRLREIMMLLCISELLLNAHVASVGIWYFVCMCAWARLWMSANDEMCNLIMHCKNDTLPKAWNYWLACCICCCFCGCIHGLNLRSNVCLAKENRSSEAEPSHCIKEAQT